jgi:hypothetical protein
MIINEQFNDVALTAEMSQLQGNAPSMEENHE